MDLNLLSMFTAVAEAGNFRAAADRLGVTRSAFSQGMQRLENALEQPLFHRTTRSVRLTEEGERLLQSVLNPLNEISSLLPSQASCLSILGAEQSLALPSLQGSPLPVTPHGS